MEQRANTALDIATLEPEDRVVGAVGASIAINMQAHTCFIFHL